MIRKLYVGNLAPNITDEILKEAFEQVGPVKRAQVIMDKLLGGSRGFGFVEMEDRHDLDSAIAVLNGVELEGRAMMVQLAANPGRGPQRANFYF